MAGRFVDNVDVLVQKTVAFLFLSMVVVGLVQIANRYLPLPSMSWTEELQRYLHIWLVFFAIPMAYRKGRHICIRLFSRLEQGRLGQVLEVSTHILWALLAMAFIVFGAQLVSVGLHQYSAGLGLQMAWIYLCQIFGGAALLIFALERVLGPKEVSL